MRFRLTAPHYIDGRYLDIGTEIEAATRSGPGRIIFPDGSSTITSWGPPPTVSMVAVDHDAQLVMERRYRRPGLPFLPPR
jgi:hypothetical protein